MIAAAPLASGTLRSSFAAKDLDKYKWEEAFIVMIAWLLIVLLGKTLIRRKA
jgi:hypothetical protein